MIKVLLEILVNILVSLHVRNLCVVLLMYLRFKVEFKGVGSPAEPKLDLP